MADVHEQLREPEARGVVVLEHGCEAGVAQQLWQALPQGLPRPAGRQAGRQAGGYMVGQADTAPGRPLLLMDGPRRRLGTILKASKQGRRTPGPTSKQIGQSATPVAQAVSQAGRQAGARACQTNRRTDAEAGRGQAGHCLAASIAPAEPRHVQQVGDGLPWVVR